MQFPRTFLIFLQRSQPRCQNNFCPLFASSMLSFCTHFPAMLEACSKPLTSTMFTIQQRRSKNMLYQAAAVSRRALCEISLHHLDGYIVSQVHRLGRCYSRDIHPAVLDLEL